VNAVTNLRVPYNLRKSSTSARIVSFSGRTCPIELLGWLVAWLVGWSVSELSIIHSTGPVNQSRCGKHTNYTGLIINQFL
jgi:hypothetical protein